MIRLKSLDENKSHAGEHTKYDEWEKLKRDALYIEKNGGFPLLLAILAGFLTLLFGSLWLFGQLMQP